MKSKAGPMIFVLFCALAASSQTLAQSTKNSNDQVDREMKRVESLQTIQNEWGDSLQSESYGSRLRLKEDPSQSNNDAKISAKAFGQVEPNHADENLAQDAGEPVAGYARSVDTTGNIENDLVNKQERERYIRNYKNALIEEIQRQTADREKNQSQNFLGN